MVAASRVFNLSTIFGWKSEFAASNFCQLKGVCNFSRERARIGLALRSL